MKETKETKELLEDKIVTMELNYSNLIAPWVAQVERYPDKIAVVFQAQELTYAQLNQRANQLAYRLLRQGIGTEQLVGLSIAPSLEMIIAVWGILKAGAAFLPLDPSYPIERLCDIIQDSQVNLIVTTSSEIGHFSHQTVRLICLDAPAEDSESCKPQLPIINPRHLAVCLYTSGSTGRPKGVLIEHHALVSHCLAMRAIYEYSDADRGLLFASLNYVAALEQLFLPLLSGARLIIREPELWNSSIFPSKVRTYGLTVIDLPPAYLHTLLEGWQEMPALVNDLPLRLIIVGGEETHSATVQLWRRSPLRAIRFLNAYGMTETPVTAVLYQIPPEGDVQRLPIGYPTPGWEIDLLDEQLMNVPEGELGEICVGGAGLARGYLHQPTLTAEKFVIHPMSGKRLYRTGDLGRFRPDGLIEYLGRKDHQVQIRGFRVELEEIEIALLSHAAVKEAALVTIGECKLKRLVAYAVPRKDWITSHTSPIALKDELRNYLSGRLPSHMVPDSVILLESMLLTPNGKVDRQALLNLERMQSKRLFRVQLSNYGAIDNLALVPVEWKELAPDEVEITTHAASLNFRDVLNVLGMLEEYNSSYLGIKHARDVALGYECSGLVTKVGSAVSDFRIGDEVIAYASGSLTSLLTVKTKLVAHKPKCLSFMDAAAIPTVFLTVYYALKILARIKPGDKILIHAAAGGIGQAAVQLAQQVGAEILATASPGKWNYLKTLGVEWVMNSRTLDFSSAIINGSGGVDIVLNSLNGEFISKSLDTLKKGGSFIELGKLGIWTQEQVAQYRPDVAYHAFDLGDIIHEDPALIAELMREIIASFESGKLLPLPVKIFPIEQVRDAFRYLAQAKHIGKVVLSFITEAESILSAAGMNELHKSICYPRTRTERAIAELWKKILSVDNIDIKTNFLDAGGNSLLALELLYKLQQMDLAHEMHWSLPILLRYNTVEQQAQQIDLWESLHAIHVSENMNQDDYEEGIL